MASQYQIDRAVRPDTRPHSDLHTDADHLLARQRISDDDRAAALTYMQRAAPDLIHMLGLGGPVPGEPLSPIDVDCPDCTGTATNRCTSDVGRDVEKFHIGRVRLAAGGAQTLQEA